MRCLPLYIIGGNINNEKKQSYISDINFTDFINVASSLHSYAQKNPLKLMPKLIALDRISTDSAQSS